jgi:hypothetical protein
MSILKHSRKSIGIAIVPLRDSLDVRTQLLSTGSMLGPTT